MTTRTQIAKTLTKQSLQVIKENKRLLLFPLIQMILLVTLILLIIGPLEHLETVSFSTGHLSAHQYTLLIVLTFGLFLGIHIINIFFSAALTAGALQHIQTHTSDLSLALKTMLSNTHYLLAWVFIMTNLGFLIRVCESWINNWKDYKIAKKLMHQLPWLIGSLFVIPAILAEQKNPLRALKRSTALITERWGFVTRSRTNIGAPLVLSKIATFIPSLLGIYFGGKFNLYLGSITTAILFFGISILDSASRVILNTALYIYAMDPEKTEHFFNNALLKNAFYCPKKRL